MKTIFLLLSLCTLVLFSCNRVKQETKETLNKGGETVGKTATEFFEGVSQGVEKSLQCQITLSDSLAEKGLKMGTQSIRNGLTGGTNNRIVLYLIFDKDFDSELKVKAFGKDGLEIGRSKLTVSGKAGDAGYFDIEFDKRTYIEVKSTITIE